MGNNVIKRLWNKNALTNIEDLRGMTFQAEEAGHTFEIRGVDEDGNTIALSGTPAGVMLRPDNTDVALTCAVSEGVVTATLPAECYDVPGRFGLTVYLTSDGQKTAIYAAIGSVSRTSSGNVSPATTASVVDLINAIEDAIEQIPASDTNLKAALAQTYSTSAVYAVGSYAWYNGKLYRCTTAITSGETWTSAHWTDAKLGQDVCDLKSATDNAHDVLSLHDTNEIESTVVGVGYIAFASGAVASSSRFSYTNYININAFDLIFFKRTKATIASPATGMAFYDKDQQYISGIRSLASQSGYGYEDDFYTAIVPQNAVYARFSVYTDVATYGAFELYGKSRIAGIVENVETAKFTPEISGTYNGITISVEQDGSLKLYGAASSARRFLCLNGQIAIKTTTGAFSKTFDEGIYEIETEVTGYISSLLWKYTYSTFANESNLVTKDNPKEIVNFTSPAMVGIMFGESSDFGTSENPTYIKFTAKKLSAKDIVAREMATTAIKTKSITVKPLAGGMNQDFGGDTLTHDTYYSYRKISGLISINGATKINIKLNPVMSANVSTMRVYYYSKTNGAISFLSSLHTYTFASGECAFSPIANAEYFRAIFILNESTTEDLGEIVIESDSYIKELPLPNIQNPTYNAITFAYNVCGDVYTSGQLILPPNYDVTGKKVPLYVVLHGTSSMNRWDSVIGTNSGDSTRYLLQYMADEGFAVFDCYPMTSKYYKTTGQIACAPLPMIKRAFESGIEYVCEHYNVDINNVCFSAFSLGGQLGYYFAGSSPIKPKAVAMFAPSIGYASMIFKAYFLQDKGRQLIVDVLGLNNDENATTFIETNKGLNSEVCRKFVLDHQDQFAGFIGYADNVHGATYQQMYEWMTTGQTTLPEWMVALNIPAISSGWTSGVPALVNHPELTKYEPTPIKYWAAFDDENTSTHANYTIYTWLKNGGSDVQWRTLPNGGGGHHAIDTSPTAEKTSGTTRLGIEYTDISVAYKEMADFFYYQMDR